MGKFNKKGEVSTPENPGDSKLMLWVRDVALKYEGDDCLIWPFPRDPSGYGHFTRQDRKIYAHRYICERLVGPAPGPKYHAAHSCDNGHLGCVNYRHLSWKSNAENQVDRRRVDPVRLRFKLMPAQVEEIRRLKGKEQPHITARRYGIGEAHTRHIQSGRARPLGKKGLRQLSDAEVHAIRAAAGTKPDAAIAADYDVGHSTIWRIRHGISYAHVPLAHNIQEHKS